jgi:hypothetical protein
VNHRRWTIEEVTREGDGRYLVCVMEVGKHSFRCETRLMTGEVTEVTVAGQVHACLAHAKKKGWTR